MPQGLVSPNNGILAAGVPIITEYEVRTATSCYPGRLVITDTNAYSVQVATRLAATTLGVLDAESEELRTTIYGSGDQARVLSGPCEVLIPAESGCTITIGLSVVAGSGGTVVPAVTAGQVVGIALTASTAGAPAAAGGNGATLEHWVSSERIRVRLVK